MIHFTLDLIGFVLFGLAIWIIYRSDTTAAGTAFTLPCMMIIITFADKPVSWYGLPIFPGQFYLAFTCVVALAAVHARLGPLAAHRVWRLCTIALILCFLIATRFFVFDDHPAVNDADIVRHYAQGMEPIIRLWASVIFLFIFVGGTGQVIWKITNWEGWKRYVTLMAGFPAASVLHSLIAFYGTGADLYWERVFWSAVAGTYAGGVMLSILRLLIWLDGDTEAKRAARIKASARELLKDGDYRSRNGYRGVSSARRKQDGGC